MKRMLMLLIPALTLVSCGDKSVKTPALDMTDLDLSVAPGENFYLYANGGWMAKNPLKPEFARYGSFDQLAENNEERLNALFKDMAAQTYEAGSVEQKISDLYKQGLDSIGRNAAGAQPLKKYLDAIYGVSDKPGLIREIGELNKIGGGGFFGMGVMEDLMDSNNQILYMTQCSLGMGERDYYVNEANADKKKGYLEMLTRFFTLSGIENPGTAAANALAVEDKLAQCCWSKTEMRDLTRQYNPMSTEDFLKAYPGFDFKTVFDITGIAPQEKIIIMQPSFYDGLSRIFAEEDLQRMKDYVAAMFINDAAGSLSDEFYDADFDFFSRQMRGITEKRPRWKRAMSVPNGILGEAVGQMYVAKYFPESSKLKVLDIVNNLKTSLSQHIAALDWMTDSTKAYAQEKLAAFTVKIGYPDKWKDYSTLDIRPEKSYLENKLAASAWYTADNLSKLGKPTDRSEWGMSPQTVNAYYNPTSNEICFPAAILQPPFFNPDADDAVNYGAIGVVIGHEMTHGFDDQGRLFDKDGNMNNWWRPEDTEAFNAKTAVLEKQYNGIEILPGIFANGKLSLGENIADQGGVGLALTALKNSWNGKHPADIDSFTAEQRFFLGFAHVWAGNITDEEKERRTKMDEHSLSVNRVNGTLRNFQEFFDAFGIREDDKMWRPAEERVMIW
ncbi:MAG: M13 family metallopeptidase [Alistipes sp.]|nr:M13 family metallopeptidase [Candidatus Minthomonas equi]